MGFLWDMIQHGQIQETAGRAQSLEARVDMLEANLRKTNETLMKLLQALEQRFGEDLDRDGKIG